MSCPLDSIRPHTVEKIGGTSIAATDKVFDNVLIGGRSGAGLYNRIFVVSAYAGMTDLLLEHKKTGEAGVYSNFIADDAGATWEQALDAVHAVMRAKNAEIFTGGRGGGSRKIADAFVDERVCGLRDCLNNVGQLREHGRFRLTEPLADLREMLAAAGEAHSAHNTALLLRDRGVNAVFVDLSGWQNPDRPSLDEQIQQGMKNIDPGKQLPIVTGYAYCQGGMVSRYDRGYSEVTFSRLAVITGAHEAIIHKEFHLSSADPGLVGKRNARKIGLTNYDVADQLANLGMEAIHPGAGKGLRQSNIPLRVKNIFHPDDEGTLICGGYVSATPRIEIIAGLREMFALEFFEQDMVGEKGYDLTILEFLAHHKAWIVSKSSNANTITHYLSTSAKLLRRIINDLEIKYPGATIAAHTVSMVSLIGSDISAPGFLAKAVAALGNAGIKLLGLQHQIRNVDIQFIIERDDFEKAIRVLHAAMIEPNVMTAPLSNSLMAS